MRKVFRRPSLILDRRRVDRVREAYTVGELVIARVERLLPGRRYVVNVGTITLIAECQWHLAVGECVYVRVESLTPDIVLKVISHDEVYRLRLDRFENVIRHAPGFITLRPLAGTCCHTIEAMLKNVPGRTQTYLQELVQDFWTSVEAFFVSPPAESRRQCELVTAYRRQGTCLVPGTVEDAATVMQTMDQWWMMTVLMTWMNQTWRRRGYAYGQVPVWREDGVKTLELYIVSGRAARVMVEWVIYDAAAEQGTRISTMVESSTRTMDFCSYTIGSDEEHAQRDIAHMAATHGWNITYDGHNASHQSMAALVVDVSQREHIAVSV